MINKAIILCGGLATRFLPISKCIPKEMLPILNKPVIQYLVEDLVKSGINQVLIINGRNKESIVKLFDRNVEIEQRLQETNKQKLINDEYNLHNKVDVYFKQQCYAMGTAYAVKLAKEWVNGEPFVMLYGDELLFNTGKNVVLQLIDSYQRNKNKSVIALQECAKEDVNKYGIIGFNKMIEDDYFINRIVEKPNIEDAPSNISYIGPSLLTPEIFEEIDNLRQEKGKELILTEAFNLLAKKDRLVGVKIHGERLDVGNKLGLVKANVYFGLQDDLIKEELKKYLKHLINGDK